ncbi:haloacid dehalogenase type II [Minwuia sp.]|uniref:haloacid dehalogenase type II n=1 Tax=Minwuia sp. TaxID=2493630 RepID=UPI003A8CF843
MSENTFEGIGACVFDAYGTLFDVNSAAAHCAADLGDKWQPLAEIWRTKQLQYTWLRALMDRHTTFWQVTQDALDYGMAALSIDDPKLRQSLLDLYFRLDAYPEVKEVLTRLKDAGMKTAILSNGSPDMLDAAVSNAGLTNLLDAVYSVEAVGVFKPHGSVYQIPVDDLGLSPGEMSFQSSNGWDANGSKAFGYNVVWVNRFDQPVERIPETPDVQIEDLKGLPAIVGAA